MQKPISGEAWTRLHEKVSQQTSRFKARAVLQTEAGTHTRPWKLKMKFASIFRDNSTSVGIVNSANGRIRPVAGGTDMVDLIARYADIEPSLASNTPDIALADTKLAAPVLTPRRNIFCVSTTYRAP